MTNRRRVDLTPTAERVYVRILEDARPHLDKDNTSHPKVKLLRMVDECIDKIIPHNPCDPKRRLSGPLSNYYRVKKGRLRICYAVSPDQSHIIVLYISQTLRKDGDKNDPYAIFTNLVMSGMYDHIFEQLGLRGPRRHGVPPFTVQ